MLDLSKHYTQQPSQLRSETCTAAAVVRVTGTGFVTLAMLEETLRELEQGSLAPDLAVGLMIDLREIVGCESRCVARFGEWLKTAGRHGVQRVALVAASSVLRTATRLVAGRLEIQLATFGGEAAARAWLTQDEDAAVARASERRPPATVTSKAPLSESSQRLPL